jgi:formate hydrogenlyase subunit 6/NADH:ubiquinone oxidoreductase subunit I
VSCRMCAIFCPTGAIVKFNDAAGTFGIEHYPADCVHCGLSRDVCPAGAIVLGNEVPAVALGEGLSYRHEMDPIVAPPNQPHSIYKKMYILLGGG